MTTDLKFQNGVFSASLPQLFQTLPCDQQPLALHTWTSLPDVPSCISANFPAFTVSYEILVLKNLVFVLKYFRTRAGHTKIF